METPHANLCAAISIIQQNVLAMETEAGPRAFGLHYFPTTGLELASRLLVSIIGELETVEWHGRPGTSFTPKN